MLAFFGANTVFSRNLFKYVSILNFLDVPVFFLMGKYTPVFLLKSIGSFLFSGIELVTLTMSVIQLFIFNNMSQTGSQNIVLNSFEKINSIL